MAIIQEYSAVFPLVRLLRRLRADGCPIARVPFEVAYMLAYGDIKLPHPREQLPAKWCLVELKEDTPHGRKLSIVAGDWEHPIDIDPIGISCCERLVPPIIMYAPGEPRPDESEAGKAARWTAELLKKDPKTKKKKAREECMRLFDITANTFDKWVWREAHIIADLPMRGDNAD